MPNPDKFGSERINSHEPSQCEEQRHEGTPLTLEPCGYSSSGPNARANAKSPSVKDSVHSRCWDKPPALDATVGAPHKAKMVKPGSARGLRWHLIHPPLAKPNRGPPFGPEDFAASTKEARKRHVGAPPLTNGACRTLDCSEEA